MRPLTCPVALVATFVVAGCGDDNNEGPGGGKLPVLSAGDVDYNFTSQR